MNVSLAEIAKLVNGKIIGNEKQIISSISPIDNIQKNSLVYADGEKKLRQVEVSDAAVILVNSSLTSEKKPVIQVQNPYKAFVDLLNYFHPQPKPAEGIHPTATIEEGVQIGKHVSIGPYVVVGARSVVGDYAVLKSHVTLGEDVVIGEHSVLHPKVTIYNNCEIGSRVIIHASTVIGSDGFGYTFTEGQHLKMPHIGNVKIEDDVEIGANSTIDRASMGTTIIGQGTKIDNHVQIAHSVKMGKHNILCAFTGLAGTVKTGDRVIFAADVGVSDHVSIDDDVILGARAGVPSNKHLRSGNIYLGSPARPKDKAIELELSLTRISGMRRNIDKLKETISELKERLSKLEEEK